MSKCANLLFYHYPDKLNKSDGHYFPCIFFFVLRFLVLCLNLAAFLVWDGLLFHNFQF